MNEDEKTVTEEDARIRVMTGCFLTFLLTAGACILIFADK